MSVKKYSWSFDKRDDVWTSDTFDTVKECIEDAKKYSSEDEKKVIYVGTNTPYEPYIDAVDVLELVENAAYNQCGEVSNDWNSYNGSVMKAELAELSSKLTLVVKEWLIKNNRYPKLYSITDIREVSLSEEFHEEKPTNSKPDVCGTCSKEDVCELHEECCSKDGKSCDGKIPKGKEFLEHINLGDFVYVLYQDKTSFLIQIARFAGADFSLEKPMVHINSKNVLSNSESVESEWVDASHVFKSITDIYTLFDNIDYEKTIHIRGI